MCTVEVPTCRPICIAEVLRKAMRVRNHLNRHNSDENISYARRALFNDTPIDHELTAQILARETERIRRDVSARWNFDFETETPLTGRYLWTPVRQNPAFTTPSTLTSEEEPVPELISVADTSSASQSETSPRRATRQTRVTDYMPQRKRPASTKQRETSPESKIPRRTTSSPSTNTTKA